MLKLLSFTSLFSVFFFTTGLYRSIPVNANITYLIFSIIHIPLILIVGKNSIKSVNTINFLFLNFIFLFYMSITYVAISFNNVYAFPLLLNHFYCFVIMILLSLSFESNVARDFYEKLNKTILFTVVFCSLFNFYEAFILGAGNANTGVIGRADGFFFNPNQSSQMLLLLTALILPNYQKIGFKIPQSIFMLIVFLGIISTFSKAGVISYIIILAYIFFKPKSLSIINKSIIMLFIFIVLQNFQSIIYYLEFTELIGQNSLNRIAFNEQTDSFSTRLDVFTYGFESFKNSPIFGSGIGYNYIWSLGYGSHNIYLFYLLDMGIIGLLLLCLMLYILFDSNNLLFFIVVSLLGFFSHNLMSQVEVYVALSIYLFLSYFNNKNTIGT